MLPGLHLNILKTEKMLQFGTKNSRRVWHVIAAQEVEKEKRQTDKQNDRVS